MATTKKTSSAAKKPAAKKAPARKRSTSTRARVETSAVHRPGVEPAPQEPRGILDVTHGPVDR